METNKCHDCDKEIIIDEVEIKNGVQLMYHRGDKKDEAIMIFKCHDCYKKNKALRNFQKCEVYSRIVGYLRPVQQWNDGKQREYSERVEYELN